MAALRAPSRWAPRSVEGQLIAVVATALTFLLGILVAIEIARHQPPLEWAESEFVLGSLRSLTPVLATMTHDQAEGLLQITSSCHKGFAVTDGAYARGRRTAETRAAENGIAEKLKLPVRRVRVVEVTLSREDFAYGECNPSELAFPLEALVVSVDLQTGLWLHAEVHPHEWHSAHFAGWLLRSGLAFLVVGGAAILFIRRLSRPLRDLETAALNFGQRLEPFEVEERGPPNLTRALHAFNAMQSQVKGLVERRASALAAMSHDLRTPLTALRIKAELVEDQDIRHEIVESIDSMERISVSVLDYLKGESRAESLRRVDLSTLVESECQNFAEIGHRVDFASPDRVVHTCRPDAIARAVRNLIENAVKYGGGAFVRVSADQRYVKISVSDSGPGIRKEWRNLAQEPFERLSRARESDQGGFGLGLSIAKAVCEGHGGTLDLRDNPPRGCLATMKLPLSRALSA